MPWSWGNVCERVFGHERRYTVHDDGYSTWVTCDDCGRVVRIGGTGAARDRSQNDIEGMFEVARHGWRGRSPETSVSSGLDVACRLKA